MTMPYLHRERDELLREADKIAGETDEDDVVPSRRRARRNRNAHADSVILSSKFVVERIRERYDNTGPETFWGEFPRNHAESLEKRGVEVISNPDEQPPAKKIMTVNTPTPQKSNAVVSSAKRSPVKNRHTSAEKRSLDTREKYCLHTKDLEWLDIYNRVVTEKKILRITTDQLEHMLDALETKKNQLILSRMKNVISVLNRTVEGTSRRHETEFLALQRFMEMTPETFPDVDYHALGKTFGLSEAGSYHIWEYWKCKLQDGFFQPLVYPSAADFDYRRISLLAAWNLTSISYAQRVRHDAERIRLMFDLLQKRDHVIIKNMSREEGLSMELVELCMSPEAKHLSPDNLSALSKYMYELSAHNRSVDLEDKVCNAVRTWVHTALEAVIEEPPETSLPAPLPTASRLPSSHSRPVTSRVAFPPALPITDKPTETIKEMPARRPLKDKRSDVLEKKRRRPFLKRMSLSPVRVRLTRARLDFTTKNASTFEHTDNSCCENGPEEEGPIIDRHRSCSTYKEPESDETLYMINGSGAILREFFLPSKGSDLRSRLRSRKRVT